MSSSTDLHDEDGSDTCGLPFAEASAPRRSASTRSMPAVRFAEPALRTRRTVNLFGGSFAEPALLTPAKLSLVRAQEQHARARAGNQRHRNTRRYRAGRRQIAVATATDDCDGGSMARGSRIPVAGRRRGKLREHRALGAPRMPLRPVEHSNDQDLLPCPGQRASSPFQRGQRVSHTMGRRRWRRSEM